MRAISNVEIRQKEQDLTYYRAGDSTPHIARHKHAWKIDYQHAGKKHYVCRICGKMK